MLTYGSMEIVAYKRVAGEEIAPELSAMMYIVRNVHIVGNEHLFGVTPVRLYTEVGRKGIYTKLPFVVSDTDDTQIVFTNAEETEVDITVYVFFFDADGRPINNGDSTYAATFGWGVGPNDRGRTVMCSVKRQLGTV